MTTKVSKIDAAEAIARVNGTLSPESLHALADILVGRKYRKGERVLDAGAVCRSMLFIERGMTRQFYFKNNKDLTEHIGYESSMIICLESYFNEVPTRLMVEVLEPSLIWEIPKAEMEALAVRYWDIERMYRRIFELSLLESQFKADILRFEPVQERYAKLAQRHPEITRRAPSQYIASLLQMTPETLSRVRATLLRRT